MSNTPLPIDSRKPASGSLLTAVKDGDNNLVRRLLAQGADVHEREPSGNTAIYYAANRGHLDIARQLLEKNANVDTRNNLGETPLMAAVLAFGTGREAMLRLLLDKGANLDIKNNAGETALSLSVKKNRPTLVPILKEAAAKREKLAAEFARVAAERKRTETAQRQQGLRDMVKPKLKPGPKPPEAA